MTKPRTYDYVVYYKDQTYQTFSLTKSDVDNIGNAMANLGIAKISIGYLATGDIRSVVERVDPPVLTKAIESENPQLSFEEQAYLNELLGVQ